MGDILGVGMSKAKESARESGSWVERADKVKLKFFQEGPLKNIFDAYCDQYLDVVDFSELFHSIKGSTIDENMTAGLPKPNPARLAEFEKHLINLIGMAEWGDK